MPLTEQNRFEFVLGMAILIGVAASAIWFAFRFANPIINLTGVANRVAAGDLTPHLAIQTSDEIGQLASAFQTMVRAVQTREAELQAHAAELELLNKLGQGIASTLDLSEIAQRVVGPLARRFDDHLSSLLLYDDERAELVNYAAAGRGAHLLAAVGGRVPLGVGLIGDAAQTGATQVVNDTTVNAQFRPLPGLEIQAEVVAPIMGKGKLLGALAVSSPTRNTFQPDDVLLLETLAAQLAPAIENARLFRDLSAAYDHTLDALAAALDARDKETEGHSRRVVAYTIALAVHLPLSAEDLATIRRGALLHDIGKIGVPDAILLKPGALTEEERAIMRYHPEWGERILAGIPFLARAAEIVRSHQERWDGKGYPDGLRGEAIPFGARIFAIADTFDAITSDRPYRAARPYSVARAEIVAGSGTQFDPRVLEIFLQIPEAEWTRLRAEAMVAPNLLRALPLWEEPSTPERRAITDDLTGAYNRQHLSHLLAEERARSASHQGNVALILLGVDRFKPFNDAQGPRAGDEALREIVALLQRKVRAVDSVARYGGDEFAIVLPDTDAPHALAIAERLRVMVREHTFARGHLTISIGVTSTREPSTLPETMIARTNQALYQAKQSGGDCVRFLEVTTSGEMEMESAITVATL